MTGTFPLTEILNLLHGRMPRSTSPKLRLQNFLLGYTDWKTNPGGNLHIGERGEIATLENALGPKRVSVINAAIKRQMRAGKPGALTFSTQKSWREFTRSMRTKLGRNITLSVSSS